MHIPLPVVRRSAAELVRLRARMLCYGFRADKQTRRVLEMRYNLDRGFIHGTVFDVGLGFRVNTGLLDEFTERVGSIPLYFKDGIDGDSGFDWLGEFVECRPLVQPRCLFAPLPEGGCGHDFARLHGPNTLFLTPVRQCVFGAIGQACKFCTFEMRKADPLPQDSVMRIVDEIFQEIGHSCDIAIGGGTPNLRDFGAKYYGEMAKEMVGRFGVGLSIELVPPSVAELDELLDCGVSSLIMSLELWDERARQNYAPGKARVSREFYFEAWDLVVRRLGKGSVSSVLLVGLEDEASTNAGAKALVDRYVVPTLVPFRPYDECEMKSFSATSDELYIRCSRELAGALSVAGLAASRQAGCTACGACSLEVALENAPKEMCEGR